MSTRSFLKYPGLLLVISAILFSEASFAEDVGAKVTAAASAKTAPIRNITNFSQALRCMDNLFLQHDKKGIVITSAGIPDMTGKVSTGTKEMLITAISKMTLKSRAFDFIDLHRADDDLGNLFNLKGAGPTNVPDYYIRGSITQMDDSAIREGKGGGIALPFLDLGATTTKQYDLLSIDMSVGEAASRRILPETSTANTMIITKDGKAGEAGGKIMKMGLSFNLDLSKAEGVGAATRTLVELGLIETLGRFTKVPYWKCLDISSNNPGMMDQAREWYDTASEKDRVLFYQRKLAGMQRYKGSIDGAMNDDLKSSIAEYQAAAGLTADGRANFELYYSLLDDEQNMLVALPAVQQKRASAPSLGGTMAPEVAAPVASSNLQVNLESERGAKPVYKIGELLSLNFSMNLTGTVYCYYEDAGKNTARLFPNRFNADAFYKGSKLKLPGDGFKIQFDRAGLERVACIAADRELVVPSALRGTKDLTALKVKSLDEIVSQFKSNNPVSIASMIEITVR